MAAALARATFESAESQLGIGVRAQLPEGSFGNIAAKLDVDATWPWGVMLDDGQRITCHDGHLVTSPSPKTRNVVLERRKDPADGVARTSDEMVHLYEGDYSMSEIHTYWNDSELLVPAMSSDAKVPPADQQFHAGYSHFGQSAQQPQMLPGGPADQSTPHATE